MSNSFLLSISLSDLFLQGQLYSLKSMCGQNLFCPQSSLANYETHPDGVSFHLNPMKPSAISDPPSPYQSYSSCARRNPHPAQSRLWMPKVSLASLLPSLALGWMWPQALLGHFVCRGKTVPIVLQQMGWFTQLANCTFPTLVLTWTFSGWRVGYR